jgi:acetyltransferase-like isoleucine patch superfamily enzyme
LYDRLYRLAKAAQRFELPGLRPLYKLLYYERRARRIAWGNLARVFYYQPVFKARCDQVGPGLIVRDGVPLVTGHLRIRIGAGCNIAGPTTFAGSKLADDPVLEIGDGSHIGWHTTIAVGPRVTIGKNVMVATRCVLLGADMHPVDPVKRRTEAEPVGSLRPMVIEDDAYVATGSVIHKGVTIGKGAVVSAGSVVTRNVPPYTVVAGHPARVIWRIRQSTEHV